MSDKDSLPEEASSPGAQLPRNNPNCGKCRNHGIIVKLRGHKQSCEFRDCECDCCILTVQRRVVMAAQNAHLKQRKMEEKLVADIPRGTPPPVKGDLQLDVPPLKSTPSANPDAALHHFSRRSEFLNWVFLRFRYVFLFIVISDLEEHSYAANELIKMFSLEMNALPFVYGILGIAGNMRTAVEMIREGRWRSCLPRTSSGNPENFLRNPPSDIHKANLKY